MVAAALGSMTAVQAQTMKEEVSKSRERAAKPQALCDNSPEECGNGKPDVFGKSVDVAVLSVASGGQSGNLRKRRNGEAKDGVTVVTVKKLTAEERAALGTAATAEGAFAKKGVDFVKEASAEAESTSASAGKERTR